MCFPAVGTDGSDPFRGSCITVDGEASHSGSGGRDGAENPELSQKVLSEYFSATLSHSTLCQMGSPVLQTHCKVPYPAGKLTGT